MKTSARGFTLIELVVVIIILGILAVVVLPKFINLQGDARKAAMDGQFSAFENAVKLYHSGWLTEGNTGAIDKLSSFGAGDVASSPEGYPYSTSGISNGTNGETFMACEQLWHGITNTDFTIAHVVDADLMTSDVDIAYTYGTDRCVYRDLYFIQRGEKTQVMEYTFTTGEVVVNSAFYGADGSTGP
ncbi:hypothetical protein GCM10007978_15020 [Shewanella hanedai]|uniref:Prepilin-type N-terminal cleavage/methylation domain-containing protein n=2 Tax=Shewanella hanedai TaxID=25 RepID=A0A553JPY8_SHEHA|nr:prepilin-type N-terminal cleavage/methylation domain-containing protein [Shewanella hanedai]GGI78343.1 hypothetical protein GCM10007978_15020 [Shewanella hanedai]